MNKNHRSVVSIALGVMLVLTILTQPSQSSSITNNNREGFPSGWTGDIRLTNNTITDSSSSIASEDNIVHIIWTRNIGNYEIFHMKSDNCGSTWSIASQISNSGVSARNSDIAVGGNIVSTVWQDRKTPAAEIFYRNSTDGGATWNAEKRISTNDGFNSEGPKIAVSENGMSIHVVWVDSRLAQTEVCYKRSIDGGITWDDGLGNTNTDRRITHDLSAAFPLGIVVNNSNIHVLFGDDRDGSFDIYYIRSTDNGATWDDGQLNFNQELLLTNNATNHGPGVLAVYGTTIHVIWVDEVSPGSVYYMYYRNSTDNGATWNPIQLFTGPTQMIASPDISVEGNNVSVVWDDSRDGDIFKPEIYYKNSTDGGITWDANLRLTHNLTGASQWPSIAQADGKRHIVWWDDRDGNREIYYKRYPDFPDTTPPSHSNETPLPDSYKDAPGTNVSVHVTDSSGVNASTIQLWVNGSLVPHVVSPITDGYNISWVSGGFSPGLITCRIVAEDMLGNVLDYTWNFTVLALYEIQLQEGWNMVSLPLEQVDTTIPSVLASINSKWDVVKYYDTLDKNDPWKTYRVGSSMNDLASIDNTMGFWIKITEPYVNLTVRGIIPTSTSIPLYAGWNLVGYPTQTTQTVANALWGTGADRVEVFDPISPYIKEVGPTYIIKPGEGYWIHVPADTIWTINW